MSIGPKIKQKNPFTQTIHGTFGRFKTAASHTVYYLLSSIPIDDISELSTASELFTTDAMKFDELIQRDIDQSRVARMANDYLVASKDKIVFFPPLLACIALSSETGGIQRRYEDFSEEVLENDDQRVYHAIWDKDGFELNLALGTKAETERRLTLQNGNVEFFYDAGQIKINPKRAKLVVLDGQHRLEALRLVKKGPRKDILDNLEVPLCLVFTPRALASSNEDMVEDFRELFVRVNEEAKRVSGHFLILLQDDSYSAATIRELAESWRNDHSNGFGLLHLLEWNQRIEELTRKRTRPFSLTTIGIVHDTLFDYLFKQELAPTVLRLDDVSDKLALADPSFNYADLTDQTHGSSIDPIVLKQICEHLVPSISTLFLAPSPYRRLQSQVKEAFAKLTLEVQNHHSSFAALEEYFARYKYSADEIAENPVKSVLKEFTSWINIPDRDQIYFLHAFQHGLIRMWIGICATLSGHGISPISAAAATVEALEALALNPDPNYLGSQRKYAQRVLWINERVNFSSTAWTRDAWMEILTLTLIRGSVSSAAMKSLGELPVQDREKVRQKLYSLGINAATNYCSRLKKELIRHSKNNLAELVPQGRYLSLQSLQNGDTESKKKYDHEIEKIAEERFKAAQLELSNILEVPLTALES
jgi:DGQHR domain-containing protein